MDKNDSNGIVELGRDIELDTFAMDVMAYAIKCGYISTSVVQRRFSIGYARATRIIDSLEACGYIGPSMGKSKPRKVIMTAEKYQEVFGYDLDGYSFDDVIDYIPDNVATSYDNDVEKDSIIPRVMAYAIKCGSISASALQRRFSIGYVRAARILDGLEVHGYIGPNRGIDDEREILMTAEEYKTVFGCSIDDNE